MKKTSISFVVPVFNEAATIASFLAGMEQVLSQLSDYEFEFIFVNDGSTDDTLSNLIGISVSDPRIIVVDLSRNFGKEAALTAGLHEAHGDAVIPIDVDLQDPPEVILHLLSAWRRGYEVVTARRSDRSADSLVKRKSAEFFYWIHNLISDLKIPKDVGDFRLLDHKVVEAMKCLPENRRFMKGLFAWVGFRTTVVDYIRQPRSAGQSKFSALKLWNFAMEGITSFSTVLLRFWTYIGIVIALLAFAYMCFIIGRTLILGVDIPGYASLLAVILFLGGIQLIGIGILGEYIGRIYMESKRRPAYIVRSRYQRGVEQ
ncbi:MAG: glycosyltransferase family 2 protein [Candidatus Competibacter sp.]|nr:glycosyltransferase family 2 protein [Candidatus Competibacter sp.]